MKWLAQLMCGYQIWNLFACIVCAPFRNAAFLGHHTMTAVLSYLVCHPYGTYYVLFFLGVAELTNIPLGIVDIQRRFPSLVPIQVVRDLANAVFVFGFFALRIFVWMYVSAAFWVDTVELISSGASHDTRVSIFFLAGNAFMCFLQLFWAKKIGKFAWKMLRERMGHAKGA